MTEPRILVVDDEETICEILQETLSRQPWAVECMTDSRQALGVIESRPCDVVLTDLVMPEMDGMQLLQQTREIAPETTVVMMTARGNERIAVEAMKAGAFDYIPKPFDLDEIVLVLNRALKFKGLQDENRMLSEELHDRSSFDKIIGSDPSMLRLFDLIERVAKLNSTILIRGENGTGKELIARAIHAHSPRKDKPFTTVNCAALPEHLLESELFGHEKGSFTGAYIQKTGLFEVAEGGTLFLDEISWLTPALQVKLLRILQERELRRVGGVKDIPVDIRVLAATNEDLLKLMQEGRFREDLFYRLNVIPVELPPLRERTTDIPLLVKHFIEKNQERHPKNLTGIEEEAMKLLFRYRWPGNVRELENAIEYAYAVETSELITPQSLPHQLQEQSPENTLEEQLTYAEAKQHFELRFLTAVLDRHHWCVTKAARDAGMSKRNFYTKITNLGIDLNVGRTSRRL